MDDELLAYYDEIRRLAEAKSDSREEAEDLLSETFLAAFAYRHNGGVIEHPKTYLVHTLMHKRNSLLRRKYRLPKVVSLQTLPEDAADDFTAAEEAYERTEEAAALRRPLLYTAITRAKRHVVIVGERKALVIAIGRVDAEKRGTMLAERINEAEAKAINV